MHTENSVNLMCLKDVHRSFIVGEIEVRVLRGVDLNVHAGELLIIQESRVPAKAP